MNIVGFIRFNVPFIFDTLTGHLVVKIAASAKTVGKLSSTKSNRRVISRILRIDAGENRTKIIRVRRISCSCISEYRDNNLD